MEWYLSVLRDNYAEFNGRARRKEFWMFSLFHTLVVLLLLALIIPFVFIAESQNQPMFVFLGFVPLVIYILGTIIPGLAVTVRRLHDVGKSGWWVLTPQIPTVGPIFGIVLLVFECQDSELGDNQWGPNPKEDENLTAVFE